MDGQQDGEMHFAAGSGCRQPMPLPPAHPPSPKRSHFFSGAVSVVAAKPSRLSGWQQLPARQPVLWTPLCGLWADPGGVGGGGTRAAQHLDVPGAFLKLDGDPTSRPTIVPSLRFALGGLASSFVLFCSVA